MYVVDSETEREGENSSGSECSEKTEERREVDMTFISTIPVKFSFQKNSHIFFQTFHDLHLKPNHRLEMHSFVVHNICFGV